MWATFWGELFLWLIFRAPQMLRPLLVGVVFLAGYLTKDIVWLPLSIQAGAVATLFMYCGYLGRQVKEGLSRAHASRELVAASVLFAAVVWLAFIKDFQGFWLNIANVGRGAVDIVGSLCACYVVFWICKGIERGTPLLAKGLAYIGQYSILLLSVHVVELNLCPWDLVLDYMGVYGHIERLAVLAFARLCLDIPIAIALSRIGCVRRIYGMKPLGSQVLMSQEVSQEGKHYMKNKKTDATYSTDSTHNLKIVLVCLIVVCATLGVLGAVGIAHANARTDGRSEGVAAETSSTDMDVSSTRVLSTTAAASSRLDAAAATAKAHSGSADADSLVLQTDESGITTCMDTTTGALVTGEAYVEGRWHFFDETDGHMLTDEEACQRVVDQALASVGESEEQAWGYMSDACDRLGARWCEYGPCASDVWHFFEAAGMPHFLAGDLVPGWASDLADWASEQGRLSDTPQVGSVVMFRFPGSYAEELGLSSDHCELVVAINDDGTLQCVGAAEGGILVHTYDPNDASVVGYVYPDYLLSDVSDSGDTDNATDATQEQPAEEEQPAA